MKIIFCIAVYMCVAVSACARPDSLTGDSPISTVATPIEPSPEKPLEPITEPLHPTIDGKKVDLVRATDMIPRLVEDLKYATTDNFMKRRMYNDPRCYLLRETAEKLSQASEDIDRHNSGFRLKVWDCYRPMKIQQEMWAEYTNTPYVANPKTARHPRGRAVDITIVDAAGNDVEMPTKYDDFSPKAHPNAPTTKAAAANRALLRTVMTGAGFTGVSSEWWHFDNLAARKVLTGNR